MECFMHDCVVSDCVVSEDGMHDFDHIHGSIHEYCLFVPSVTCTMANFVGV